ncbi:ABC transporter ATP-binding protein [Planomonospora sp. ID67723]|uniref:ABC transporter ATP-binding protein n=1 Tax=Planomonospora sp. ID67723 TaxID=2738134 RepID=UPI0018C3ECA0|nr:ABC transporter ATP-binding protein [Planomonospora sp. ID67723]MBG0829603.1 ABC transporter ATP-binding protein [Planomonospora sp. ID67723]
MSRRTLPLSTAGRAVSLGWRAAPVLLLSYTVFTVVAAGLPVLVAWLTKAALDGLVRGAEEGALLGLAAALACAGVLFSIAQHAAEFLRAETHRRIGLASKNLLFRAVERFVGIAPFERPEFHDRLRLAEEAGSTSPGNVVNGLLQGAQGVLVLAGFAGSLVFINPVLALIVAVSTLPALVAENSLAREKVGMMARISPMMRREMFFSRLLTDSQPAKEARLFGFSAFMRERISAERTAANEAEHRLDRKQFTTQSGLSFVSAGVAGLGLVWTVLAARSGTLSLGDVSMLVASLAGTQTALSQLVQHYAATRQALLMFGHYLELTEAETDLPVPVPARQAPPLRSGIELRDVWFRYSDEHDWILRGVDLFIPHGSALALVGRNGAGKSTLVKLLCRFYDPTRGAILWDGVDLRTMDPHSLRARVSAVFQDFMQYDMTAAENIGLGDVDALGDRAALARAADVAGIHRTLAALPGGYDTMLSRSFAAEPEPPPSAEATDGGPAGELSSPASGFTLSTGQWQRLAVARAFFRGRRDLLILDEPSSGLDAAAEYRLHSILRRHRSGRTSVLISHRMNTLRDADLIVVLVDGRIAERGSHTGLMAAEGEYARLFSLQAEGYTEPAASLGMSDTGSR